jgi:hypothetical protein
LKNYRVIGLALVAGVSVVQGASAAKIFEISDRTYGKSAYQQYTKTQLDQLFDGLEDGVNKSLPAADPTSFLKSTANATAISTKGLTTDYATAFDIFVLGAGLGVGADLGGNSLSDLTSGNLDYNKLPGFSANMSFLLGFNPGVVLKSKIGPIDPDRLRVFMNFFSTNRTFNIVSVKLNSFGIHASYLLFEGVGTKLLGWEGLKIHTGYDHAGVGLSATQTLTQSQDTTISTVPGLPPAKLTAAFTGPVTVGANASISTIPIEASTSVRLLYVLSLYGGLGTDLNFGSSTGIGTLTGNLTATDSTSTLADANEPIGGKASLTLGGQKAKPSAFSMRGFGGVQLNMGVLNLFVQANKAFTNDALGVSLGAKAYW